MHPQTLCSNKYHFTTPLYAPSVAIAHNKWLFVLTNGRHTITTPDGQTSTMTVLDAALLLTRPISLQSAVAVLTS
jgi:hypothetical protein